MVSAGKATWKNTTMLSRTGRVRQSKSKQAAPQKSAAMETEFTTEATSAFSTASALMTPQENATAPMHRALRQ